MRSLEYQAAGNETDATRSFNRHTAYLLSIIGHLTMCGADTAVAGLEGSQLGKTGALGAVLGLACLAALANHPFLIFSFERLC